MFARIHSSWQVLGYTTYSVSLQPDPQFMVGLKLHHLQCLFTAVSTLHGRSYVITPPTCIVCFHLDLQFIGGPVLFHLLCQFPATARPTVHDRSYMNLTTIKPVLYQRKLRPGKGLALVRFVRCCTSYSVFSRERHKPQLLCLS